MNRIFVIFRKELLEVVRDRKTLMFALLMPMVAFPLLMLGVAKFTEALIRKRALQEVVVAADPLSQDRYLLMAHEWFQAGGIGKALKLADSPLGRVLVSQEIRAKYLGDLPEDLFDNPNSFRAWARDLAEQAGNMMEQRTGPAADLPAEITEVPAAVREQAGRFFRVVIKGVGQVKFTSAAGLSEPPDEFQPGELPKKLANLPNARKIAWAIQNRQIHAYMQIPENVKELEEKDTAQSDVLIVYDSTIPLSDEARDRISGVVDEYKNLVVEKRLERHGFQEAFLKPIEMEPGANLASKSKQALAAVGGFIPYIIIIFAYLGAIFPAIDIGAGEKERNTLETLLLTPPSRVQVATGKYLTILFTSLVAALLSVISLVVSVKTMVPAALLEQLDFQMEPITALMMVTMAVPVAAIFAGILFATSIYARSFKEAQNYMSPVGFLLIIPAAAAMIPDLEINAQNAMIPLVNVSLLMKAMMKGEVNYAYYGMTILSSAILACLCIAYAVWQFKREEVLFRT